VRLAEAPSFGKTILAYDPRSRGAEAYIQLAKEIWQMSKEPDRNPRKALVRGFRPCFRAGTTPPDVPRGEINGAEPSRGGGRIQTRGDSTGGIQTATPEALKNFKHTAESIQAGEEQPRDAFDLESWEELSLSIKSMACCSQLSFIVIRRRKISTASSRANDVGARPASLD